MFDVYDDIFNQRGKDYDLAMRQQPYARKNEFIEMFRGINLSTISTILDIPSGGGYLKNFLNKQIVVAEYDSAKAFLKKASSSLVISEKFDLVYCLASLHHIVDKTEFINEAINVLQPSGYLCIGDVLKGSQESVFLDDFIGKYNGMGHTGLYLENRKAYLESLNVNEAKILRSQYVACPWCFHSDKNMLLFFRTLFSLKDISDDLLFENINNTLGIRKSRDEVSVNFNLLYVTYQKHS